MTEEELDVEKLKLEIAELKKPWWKKPSSVIALFLTVLVSILSVYGFAGGYFQVSFIKPANQTYDLRKQTEVLQSEVAEISSRKEAMEQKRDKILKQLENTKILLEETKNSSAEVKAHIEVLSSACLSCPTPAWVQSQRKIFAALEEIEKILSEDKSDAPAAK